MTKLKKNTGHATPLCSHTTSIVRMPKVRSLGRLIALIGVYGFQSRVYEFSSMLLIASNFEGNGCPPLPTLIPTK
jgi:hypothetical protein